MAIFKNLKGEFFEISADELAKFRLTDDDARTKLKNNSLDGAEVSSGDDGDDVTGQSQSAMHQRTC